MADKFWRFNDPTVSELTAQLNAAGAGAFLDVRLDAKKRMTLQVMAPGAKVTDVKTLNDSHICPGPLCPK